MTMRAPRRRVLIVAPMRMELRPVVRALGARRSAERGVTVQLAWVGDVSVVAAPIGVGPTIAARNTIQLLDAQAPDFVLVSGIAGGLDPQTAIGTVLVPETVIDRGSGRRFHPEPIPGVEPAGVIATSHELITDDARLDGLRADGVVAVDMETAAVAEVCTERSVPWSAFRAVSDRPSDGLVDQAIFAMLQPDGRSSGWRAARFVVTHPRRLPHLVRLGRDSSLGARRAAQAAVAACARL